MTVRWTSSLTQLVQTFGREFLFVYRIAPKHAIGLTITQVLIGLLPPAELWVAAKIIDLVTQSSNRGLWNGELIFVVSLELTLLVIKRIVFSINDYYMAYLRSFMDVEVNDRIHRMILALDLPTFEQPSVHTATAYLREQSWRPVQMVTTVFQTLGNMTASVSYFAITFSFSPVFSMLFLGSIIPDLIISVRAATAVSRQAWGKASLMKKVWYFASLFRFRTSLVEMMIHRVGSYFADRYKHTYVEVMKKEVAIETSRLRAGLSVNIISFVIYGFVYVQIVRQAIAGILSIGQLTFFVGAFLNLERFLVSQVWQFAMLIEHTKYLDAFRELEHVRPTICDTKEAVDVKTIQSIEFRDVSFFYPNLTEPALSHLSFVIHHGNRIAFVGENGAGKSTLVKLLLRLYEPTTGRILFNGKDYRDYTIESIRKQIGVTFQDFEQFSLTARENIAIGEIEYLDELAHIQEAAERAGIHERIVRLPSQYETPLGHEFHEAAVQLSGGEWQKLALARSLIKDASVLVLDEPTAALDARSEFHFFQELFVRAHEQTVIVISHRFSSVRVADRILVLRDGTLIEQGTHDTLMKQKGLYRELYQLQTKEIETV